MTKKHRPRFSPRQRRAIYLADEGVCYLCGNFVPWDEYQGEHVVPVCKGGVNDVVNGRVSCASCNSRKGAKALDDFLSTCLSYKPDSLGKR